jgi:hypothetical protein
MRCPEDVASPDPGWPGAASHTGARGEAAQPPADGVPPTPTPAQPLPGAGALAVCSRTGRVHALEAATGVEAHLARPTLDVIFLALIDVCVTEGGGW